MAILIDITQPIIDLPPQILTKTALDGGKTALVDDPVALVDDAGVLVGSLTSPIQDLRIKIVAGNIRASITPRR